MLPAIPQRQRWVSICLISLWERPIAPATYIIGSDVANCWKAVAGVKLVQKRWAWCRSRRSLANKRYKADSGYLTLSKLSFVLHAPSLANNNGLIYLLGVLLSKTHMAVTLPLHSFTHRCHARKKVCLLIHRSIILSNYDIGATNASAPCSRRHLSTWPSFLYYLYYDCIMGSHQLNCKKWSHWAGRSWARGHDLVVKAAAYEVRRFTLGAVDNDSQMKANLSHLNSKRRSDILRHLLMNSWRSRIWWTGYPGPDLSLLLELILDVNIVAVQWGWLAFQVISWSHPAP